MGFLSSGDRDPTRRDLAISGIAVLAVILLLLGGLTLKLQGHFTDSVPVTAELESAGGAMRTGVDVKMRGMAVGKVTAIDGDADEVRLSLEINKDQLDQIPSDVLARVLPASVFGTSYVDLVIPPGSETKGSPSNSLSAHDVIKEDTSQGTLELQTALDSIDALVDALGPAELATALHTVATVLDGRGDDIGVAIDTLNRYTKRFAPVIPRIRSDLKLLAVNLEAVARNAPDLLDATDDALVTLQNLVDRRDKITQLLDGGLLLVQDTQDFLTKHERAYLHALSLSQTLVDGAYDERTGLRDTLLETGVLSHQLLTILEDGYGRVEGYIYARGPEDYTKADCPRYGSAAGANCG
ncbi:MCE family protein [Nocardioides humilatus]|uniref:MCE family protein n=1 Tax=Nocardioides humilatus TaxID=2607660 RepID=A0A5B1LGI3_9ACTN|nr:MCE family protein [Nocardioides humilatus]KAA1419318.1 MCE family protein [Nocardioides humilatus]